MNRSGWKLTVSSAAVAGLLTVAGCTADDEGPGAAGTSGPASAPAPSASSSPAAPAAAEGVVRSTGDLMGVPVEVAVGPVEVRDGVAVVPAEYTVAPDRLADFVERVNDLGMVLDGEARGGGDAGGLMMIDDDARTVAVASSTTDDGVASSFVIDDEAEGYAARSVTAFPAPSGDAVDVLIPHLGFVLDVPVTDASSGFDEALAEIGPVAEREPFEMRGYSQAYDDSSSTTQEAERVTVTLTSDVLFDSSSAELSAKAKKAIVQVVEQIKADSEEGAVSVVGHTDDVDTDAFNQKLSEKRAKAVASRLKAALGSGFSVESEGRGESEPVAEGTSGAARAANRRVEISFDGHAFEPEAAATASGVPDTQAPVGTAGETLSVSPNDDVTYGVTVDSMTRTNGMLYGSVRLELLKGEGASTMWGVLRPGQDEADSLPGRGFGVFDTVASAHNLALLTPDARVYPFDFRWKDDDGEIARALVGDDFLAWSPKTEGQSMMATAVWPDTGQDTVTLEVPGKFRITDIPVTEG